MLAGGLQTWRRNVRQWANRTLSSTGLRRRQRRQLQSVEDLETRALLTPAVDLNGPDAGIDFAATFTEDAGPVLVQDTDLTVSAPVTLNITGATVTITNLLDGVDEVLAADTSGTAVVASYTGGVLTLTGTDSPANYQQVLRTVAYDNASQDPDVTDRAIEFVVTNVTGDSAVATTTLTVVPENDDPTLTVNPVAAINENEFASVSGSIVDPDSNMFTLDFDWGDGSANNIPLGTTDLVNASFAGDIVNWNATTGVYDVQHQYLDDGPSPGNGTTSDNHPIDVTVTDDGTAMDTGATSVTVTDVAPTLVLDPVTAIDENGVATLTGSVTDPGTLDVFTFDVNWGDPLSPDNTESFTIPASAAGTQTFSFTHQYLDDNPTATGLDTYSITATVTDDDTLSDSGGTSVSVSNIAPQFNSFDTNDDRDNKAIVGEEIDVFGAFTDVGSLDTHTVEVDWDDGTTTNSDTAPGEFLALDVDGGGSGSFTAAHTYSTGGIFEVTATITDDDTGVSTVLTTEVYVSGVRLTSAGELQIIGTSGRDIVTAASVGRSGQQVNVITKLDVSGTRPGTEAFVFDAADINTVLVVLCEGNDTAKLGGGHVWYSSSLIIGDAGHDKLTGGIGNDVLLGSAGRDAINGRNGDDSVQAGSGRDTVHGSGGNDTLIGSNGPDRVFGTDGDDIVVGGRGIDWLEGGPGDDELVGGDEADTLIGSSGEDSLDGGGGNDYLNGGHNNDVLNGGNGNDLLNGESAEDRLDGGAGNDTLLGANGRDILFGGTGNDDLRGGNHEDIIDGGAGNDSLRGEKGRDILIGGGGLDHLNAGSSEDILIGGSTTHDEAALQTILAEWTSTRTYAAKVDNIRGVAPTLPRENGANFLDNATVVDDAAADEFIGARGADWFFADGVLDLLTDHRTSEELDLIP